jgi:hypothetical protein
VDLPWLEVRAAGSTAGRLKNAVESVCVRDLVGQEVAAGKALSKETVDGCRCVIIQGWSERRVHSLQRVFVVA